VAQTSLPNMTVVSVGDGDTLRVRNQQGQAITIRLGCVDAPELKQNPWGQQSRTRLQQLLPVGQSVQVRQIERDRYKLEFRLSNKKRPRNAELKANRLQA
ncbi:thermonuclease family protein, partial [Nostoc sp. NIES-2111]